MPTRRHLWTIALAACAVLALSAAPAAFADENHAQHGRDRDDNHARVQARDADDDDDMAAGLRVETLRVDELVTALTNDVTTLSNLDLDDEGNLSASQVKTVSLATLETGMTPEQVSIVTATANANAAALQTFLAGGSDNANAVNAALSAAGISSSSALAILPRGDDGLLVITA
jgi:hypothetical protein